MIRTISTFASNVSLDELDKAPNNFQFQKDANEYFADQIEELWLSGIVSVQDTPPLEPRTGSLWYDTAADDLTLYIYTGSEWVSASPPVSLDGIEASIASVDAELMKINANVAMNKSELDEKALDIQLDQDRQDAEIQELHKKVNDIAEEFDRGKWAHVTEKTNCRSIRVRC